jgi:MFS family permease
MTQINKFYLASFLKNQIYFVPIIVLFFQDLGLDYAQIFWIFTAGSIFAFIIEIPTGILADLYGKRTSIIWSKFTIFLAFIAFALAGNFWGLLLANLLYELGKSFRSGTETAFVYNYLLEDKSRPSYTKVKSNQKFYARISESIGTALGGFLAYQFGFSFVFFVAAIPAFINFLQTLTWEKIKENLHKGKFNWRENALFATDSIKEIFQSSALRKVVANIAIFTAVFVAADKFIQPYMREVGIDIQYFGLIYSAFLILTAFLVRYSYKLEDKFGGVRLMNYLTLLAFLPLILLGTGISAVWGVALFFFVMMVENIRSPIANTLFHQNVNSDNRSTMGSILQLFKSLAQLILLPVIGYSADIYSASTAILILGVVVFLNATLFWISRTNLKEKTV